MLLQKRNDFGLLAEQHKLTGLGAEVGVQYGVFTERIAQHYTGHILAVDIWLDKAIEADCRARLQPYPERYTMVKKTSLKAAEGVADGSLDWVYIDANHYYEHVLADIRAWYPKVRSGGIIAGHDYCHYTDIEVIQAVTQWCAETGYTVQVTNHPDDCWQGIAFPTWYTIKK